jgi:hypothetical protein
LSAILKSSTLSLISNTASKNVFYILTESEIAEENIYLKTDGASILQKNSKS